jgi:hypothetical protein
MADATTKVMWVQTVLNDLHVSCPRSARLWCDNMGIKYLASNPIFHGRMKHIKVDSFYPWSSIQKIDWRLFYFHWRSSVWWLYHSLCLMALPKLCLKDGYEFQCNLNLIKNPVIIEGMIEYLNKSCDRIEQHTQSEEGCQ